MWHYCPKCNVQNDLYGSRFNIFSCKSCGFRFRAIYAKINKIWHGLQVIWDVTKSADELSTTCPFCHKTVFCYGRWPTVCSACTRDLPLDEPENNSGATNHFAPYDGTNTTYPIPSFEQPREQDKWAAGLAKMQDNSQLVQEEIYDTSDPWAAGMARLRQQNK